MKIKEVSACEILDSRKEKTIFVSIKTNVGSFSASSPNGKSTGKFESKPYKKSLDEDIKKIKELSDYFSEEEFTCFDCLEKIEYVVKGYLGANTTFALESAVLKAIAKEKKKEVWQLINPESKKFPRLVGNVIGGGKHSQTTPLGVHPGGARPQSIELGGKKPDFQEFLLIPKTKKVKEAFELNKKAKEEAERILKKLDDDFKSKKTDENAWMTSLNEKLVLDILYKLKGEFNMEIGVDLAASGFYKRKKYHYLNPKLDRGEEEQLEYLSNLIKNYNLFYIEDPFNEENFESFSKLLKKFPDKLIVGDDLAVTNSKRLEKAIEKKSINAIIVKPNQCGSLLEVKKVCELAKKHKIKIVFSHRSGETEENILADLAFGFEADFFKCGIDGNERISKINRLIEIERNI